MQPDRLRIVFMGTPELASHMLSTIHENGYQVAGVVTAPDRPAGRGRKIKHSPVKQYALEQGLRVMQPTNLKSPEFIEELSGLKPDLQVVVAFRMLPKAVWSIPSIATFNLHASLLPDYRGAAPINHAIINGEKETGVTTFVIDDKIDTGQILFREKIIIDEFETAGSLHEKVKQTGGPLILKTIDALAENKVRPVKQTTLISDPDTLNKAPKIFKEDCRINWNQPCRQVVNHIHGLSPVPGAFTEYPVSGENTIQIKILEARPLETVHGHQPGTLLTDNKTYIHFAATDGFVKVRTLQIPGKKRMQTEELLRGFNFPAPNLR
ncbi:MAG: methionyl-tRNA formyltransferase [Bacteroidales bacterium]